MVLACLFPPIWFLSKISLRNYSGAPVNIRPVPRNASTRFGRSSSYYVIDACCDLLCPVGCDVARSRQRFSFCFNALYDPRFSSCMRWMDHVPCLCALYERRSFLYAPYKLRCSLSAMYEPLSIFCMCCMSGVSICVRCMNYVHRLCALY